MKKLRLASIAAYIGAIFVSCYTFADSSMGTDSDLNSPGMFRGQEANALEMALYVSPASSTNGTPIICTPVLTNRGTNVLWLYVPPKENRYQLELFGSNGKPVAETSAGAELGTNLTEPLFLATGVNYKAGYAPLPPLHQEVEMLSALSFKLQDYFDLTNPGAYVLKFQMNVIWFPRGWKGSRLTTNLPIVKLPPLEARINIK